MGAQRLMLSHRNMLADLKTKQALENMRADVVVKLDVAASRHGVHSAKGLKGRYADTMPRIDTGLTTRGSTAATTKRLGMSGMSSMKGSRPATSGSVGTTPARLLMSGNSP